jgi:DNA-3-methyladenine glycosylase II
MNFTEIENGINHIYNNDKYLAKIIKVCEPCLLTPQKDYFKMLLRSIIQQQLSIKSAAAIHGRFIKYFKGNLRPESIHSARHDILRGLGLSNAKVKYVKNLSEKILMNEISLKGLAKKSDEEIIELLTKVKGIGVWTVHMFLIFTLGRLNVLPVNDLGIKRAIMQVYGLKHLPDEKKIYKISNGNGWHPYNSIACWYLWRSLEL